MNTPKLDELIEKLTGTHFNNRYINDVLPELFSDLCHALKEIREILMEGK